MGRECYCSNFVSALSAHLSDSHCDLPCQGNSSEICGGNLALSVYQAAKGAGSKSVTPSLGHILALGIAIGALFCLV